MRATIATIAVLVAWAGIGPTAPAGASGYDTGLPALPTRSREALAVTAAGDGATSGSLAAYARASPSSPWRRVLGPWPAELGRGGLSARRREGDGTTPLGLFALGPTLYGNAPRPDGLHEAYRRLGCGDWWDEDPASPRYNRFVVVPCAVTPSFAPGSEALWTETTAYPYFAVIEFNVGPIHRGAGARGSGIFLHSWVAGPTDGCIALHRAQLLRVLRWLRPGEAPVVRIAVTASFIGLPARGSAARPRPG